MSGIYLHIPFCKQKCTYCDFHFSTTFQSYRTEMIESIGKEITIRANNFLQHEALTTIYFGGGTPSLLLPEELKHLLDTIKATVDISNVDEITLEANPDDINAPNLIQWKELGINRLSIGVQSFRERDLKWMNRAHHAAECLSSIQLAQQHGFTNLTVDLIYGLPDLTDQEWINHIQQLIELGIPHISAYCLTVEQKTALFHLVKNQKIIVPDEDTQARQFDLLLDKLTAHGYEQYEISNFSQPGYLSKHNSNYWRNEIFLGVGPSAHSYDRQKRYWNIANNTQYIQLIKTNQPTLEEELLSPENRFNELIMTGLRTKWGVNLTELNSIFPISTLFNTMVADFVRSNDILVNADSIYLTQQGKLKADHIASSLFIGV